MTPTAAELRHALANDLIIDIVTTGAQTGQERVTEIWFVRIDGEIFICGTGAPNDEPGSSRPRDWLANLKANPNFVFRLKESVQADLAAVAEEVTDEPTRRRVFSAPETQWYRDNGGSVERLVKTGPLVRVTDIDMV